jgi:glucoamylase
MVMMSVQWAAGMAAGIAMAVSAFPAAATAAQAPGQPGAESYFDLARKDCVGTARTTSSKVWFTVADGGLSDTYWPTVDATNVHSLQYVVTDGRTFTDLQQRDMTYLSEPDATGMSCRVTASDAAHRYSITTTYITDPARDAVLMRIRFHGQRGDRLYVRLDPLAGGTGGGGSQNAGANSAVLATYHGRTLPVAYNTNTATNAVNRDYGVPTYMALAASRGFGAESVGYADSPSDGLSMLDATHSLTTYDSAPSGHVVLTAGLSGHGAAPITLALGFGTTQAGALATASTAAAQPFKRARHAYVSGWRRYDSMLRAPSRSLPQDTRVQYYRSVNVVKASEDKTFPGAIAAGLASPWGQSVPAGTLKDGKPMYFGSYREVFARDLYEAATGLLVAGDQTTARAATLFLFDRQQQADGSMPRNSLENGKVAPDTGGIQLDETSYPILMAWETGLSGDAVLYQHHVIPAADFLVSHGPSYGVERWEEQSGYSPSTIAAEIAGLTAAARIAQVNGDRVRARIYQATADDFQRNIESWDVTTSGPFTTTFGVPSYFLRITKNGDPNNNEQVNLGNGSITVDQRQLVDAGFLELVRLGEMPAGDPTITNSLKVVDGVIERSTPNGPGWYRYGTTPTESVDGYGDCYQPSGSSCSPAGAPWAPTGVGTGHLWPVLSGERGEYDVAAGHAAVAQVLLEAMRAMSSGGYLEPEQAWEDPNVAASPYGSDPATASIGFVDGLPAGSASPLTWAQAQYARLTIDQSIGHNVDTPSIVASRYVTHAPPGQLPLTITSPANGASVDTETITVTGTTAPGATVDAEAVGATGGAAATASTTADGSGSFSLPLPTGFGSTTVTVAATSGAGTAYGQITVTNVALPGSTVFDVTDPAGDDRGPGTYQYPTSGDFAPGSFDLTHLKVNQDGTNVYIQATIAHLVPTFGNSFGAQLLDVYVRNPAASSFSTDAAYPQLNYVIDSASAWSQRLEAQGFAPPIWVDAAGVTPGAVQQVVDDPSGTITLIVPQSVFGTVGPGWIFTLALTGQNGFNSYQARDFTATPGGYTFGVCAPGGTSPICSVDPNSVPKVMDTITPAEVSQSTELDPTIASVKLHGVGP